MARNFMVLLVALVFFTGCASFSGMKGNTNPNNYNGMKMFLFAEGSNDPNKLSTCDKLPPGDEPEMAGITGIIAAVLPSLLDKGFDVLAEYLKKAKENYTGETVAIGAARICLNKIPNFKKLVVVRGEFGPNNQDEALTSSLDYNLNLQAPPELFIEFVIETKPATTDISVLRIKPVRLIFNETSAKWRGVNKVKDIFVNLTFEFPVAAKDNKKEVEQKSSVQIKFKGVKLSSDLGAEALEGLTSKWTQIRSGPVSLIATVIETENSGDLFLHMAEGVSAAKDPAVKEIMKQILELLKEQE